MNKNHTAELEIIQTALENLERNTKVKAAWKATLVKDMDGEIDIALGNKHLTFPVEVKRQVTNYNLPTILKQAGHHRNLFVIAYRIAPTIKAELRQRQIAYLEGNGNVYIERGQVYLWVENNNKQIIPRERANRAFTKAGLQTVFLFLRKPDYLNKTYREIAQGANIALGNVKNVIDGMLELGFLIKQKDQLILNNQKLLFEKWATGYEEKLKPTLHIANFRFVKKTDEENWKDIELTNKKIVWGGEPGGELLTNHLRPEILTIYTTENRRALLDQLRIVPDANGNIRAYEKFWTDQTEFTGHATTEDNFDKVAHPFIVYADLMITNNKRCIETAELVYEQYIKPKL